MTRFPSETPRERVLQTLATLGVRVVREGSHLALVRDNPDGTCTPMTIPNHKTIKGSALRTILTQAGILREDFLAAYQKS